MTSTLVLLLQNLVVPKKLDSVFEEFLAIDRILEVYFGIEIDYGKSRKKFHIVCCGLLAVFLLYVVIVALVVHSGQSFNVLMLVVQFGVWLICLLFCYNCYHIVYRIQLLGNFIMMDPNAKFRQDYLELFQEIFIHFSNIVKICNRYFGLKFLAIIGNFFALIRCCSNDQFFFHSSIVYRIFNTHYEANK
jgi:hypothetical protein